MDKYQWDQLLKKKEKRISEWEHFHHLVEDDLFGKDKEMYEGVK